MIVSSAERTSNVRSRNLGRKRDVRVGVFRLSHVCVHCGILHRKSHFWTRCKTKPLFDSLRSEPLFGSSARRFLSTLKITRIVLSASVCSCAFGVWVKLRFKRLYPHSSIHKSHRNEDHPLWQFSTWVFPSVVRSVFCGSSAHLRSDGYVLSLTLFLRTSTLTCSPLTQDWAFYLEIPFILPSLLICLILPYGPPTDTGAPSRYAHRLISK